MAASRLLIPLLFVGFGASANEHELSPGELRRALESYPSARSAKEVRLVGPVRINDDGEIQIADQHCHSWLTLSSADIVSSSRPIGEKSACDGSVRPIVSIRISGSRQLTEALADAGGNAPAVKSFTLVGNVRLPGAIDGGIPSLDWNWCVDWYLRCQLDCPESGLPIDSCLRMCDAIFDATCRQ